MISLEWLSDRLCDVLRWQLEHPGRVGGPEVPWAGRRVWSIFIELSAARGGGMGPAPISYQEIESWAWIRREPMRSFELDIIRALDAAFLTSITAKADGNSSRPVQRPLPDEPPTSEAILAAFRKMAESRYS